MPVLLYTLAILPGLLICLFLYRLDKYEKESKLQLVISFALGVIVTIPIFFIQRWASGVEDNIGNHFIALLFSSFLVVALGEELAKFIALYAYPFQQRFFNEPFDGVIYAVMISMGFATLENILYAYYHGLETTLLRAFTAVPAHAAFAIIVGYYTGLAKFDEKRQATLLLKGLGIAVAVHGLYDFFILQEYFEWLIILAVVILWLSLWYGRKLVKIHQNNSPFQPEEDKTEQEFEINPPPDNSSMESPEDKTA